MNGLDPALVAKLTGEATAAQKLAVQNKMTECFEILRAKFPQANLVEPKITYDLKGAVAGRAYGGSRLELNIDLLNSKHFDDIIERTLPHEIAHIVTYQIWVKQGGYTRACKPHGRQWAYIMNCLGLAATRCHNYDVVLQRNHKRPHEYHCSSWCEQNPHYLTNLLHRRIIQEHRRYNCTACGAVLKPTGGD